MKDDDATRARDPLTTDERAELEQLRAEKRRWTIEREILKKAHAWWVRENTE